MNTGPAAFIVREILENGGRIDGPFFDREPRAGSDLKLRYVVSNTSEGHNMPSGSLGAQPQLWLNTVLIGPEAMAAKARGSALRSVMNVAAVGSGDAVASGVGSGNAKGRRSEPAASG